MRTRGRPRVGREVSRFPVKERPCMLGSLTTPGRRRLALAPPRVWPSGTVTPSAPGTVALSRLDGPACTLPCRRFAGPLAGVDARLGASVGRYTFTVEDFHLLLLAGLPAHYRWRSPC